MPTSLYEVLGVTPGASQEDIARAYRQGALHCHPDKFPEEQRAEATNQFRTLTEAYEVLGDRTRRAQYDQANGHIGGGDLGNEFEMDADPANPANCFSAEALRSFFLPRDLPGHEESVADAHVFATVASFASTWPNRFKDLVWCLAKTATKQHIAQTLEHLPAGSAAAFWLRAQNAVLFIERVDEECARLSAWCVQLPLGAVLGMAPPCMSVPSVATDDVKWDLISSSAFCRLAADLASHELSEAVVEASKKQAGVAETREPNLPVVILDFLLPACAGRAVDLSSSGAHVWKKMRDEVRYSGGFMPWRRAPAWLALKSVLHLECRRVEAVKDRADDQYKVLVLQLLTKALEHVNILDPSAQLEACRKVTRRAEKLRLKRSLPSPHLPRANLSLAPQDVIQGVNVAVEEVMIELEADWRQVAGKKAPCKCHASDLSFQEDTRHQLSNSWPLLAKMLSPMQPQAVSRPVSVPQCVQRAASTFAAHIAALGAGAGNEWDRFTALVDAEEHIANVWNFWDDGVAPEDVLELRALLVNYLMRSKQVYDGDPEGQSRRVLIATTLALLVDRKACADVPLLLEHSVGIQMEMLNRILAPRPGQKHLLASLEAYVSARDAHAQFPSSIDVNVSGNAFAVRFANGSADMDTARLEILAQCRRNQEQKKEEVRRELARYRDLLFRAEQKRTAASRRSCVYTSVYNSYHQEWQSVHSGNCEKCKLTREAESLEREAQGINIEYYEKLLPEQEVLQKAVVYELRVPELLALQRDAILMLARDLCVPYGYSESADLRGYWPDEPRLANWRTGSPQTGTLGSTNKTFKVSHYHSQHVTLHSTFIVPHGFNVKLVDRQISKPVSGFLSWTVKEITKVTTSDEQYTALQTMIGSWEHDENMVIASKSKAHLDLSLFEFEVFGTLRAGIRLQLPRLLRSIAQRSMSFERCGVLDVLVAALWQAGPPADSKSPLDVQLALNPPPHWLRLALNLLDDEPFATEMCKHTMELLQSAEANWTKNGVLLAVVHISTCIAEHSPSLARDGAHALLCKAREVGIRWLREVQDVLQRTIDIKAMQLLRHKLVDIAATTSLTFVSTDGAASMTSSRHLVKWLRLRAVVYDNILLNDEQASLMHPARRHLLRQVTCVGLRIEDQIHSLCSQQQGLRQFVLEHWSDAHGGNFERWQRYDAPADRWYKTTFNRGGVVSTLQVDVLRGCFLVDGKPIGRLPEAVTANEQYKRLFRDTIFDVQPALGSGYKTRLVKGAYFGFRIDDDGTVTFSEDREIDGSIVSAKLVPASNFKGDVPAALFEEHSHWLVPAANSKVYFRPIEFDDIDFTLGCTQRGAKYILDVESRCIEQTSTGWSLVDICSDTVAHLRVVFERLAPPDRIHTFYCGTGGPPLVLLPRLQSIRFYVHQSIRIESHEFGGNVAMDQNLGTLIGLQQGLVLETAHEKTLLLPHTDVERIPSGEYSVVKLNLSALRSPPLFVYGVRPDLQELRGQKGRLSWLYLAKLHALTSHVLPDPFTGRTGTATAIALLRSARCTGNLRNAIDDGVKLGLEEQTLQEIAKIAPRREHYPPGRHLMEKVNFHAMPGLCAHEALAFLARDALQGVSEQANLTGEEAPAGLWPWECEHMSGPLAQRAYFRSRDVYSLDGRLQKHEEDMVLGSSWATLHSSAWQQGMEDRTSVRKVALVTFKAQPVPLAVSISSLLLTSADLPGHSEENLECKSMAIWTKLSSQSLRSIWIALYEAALRPNTRDFGFLLAYMARKNPNDADHLQTLGSIACLRTEFASIPLPSHACYTRPDERDINSSTVRSTIDEYLARFNEKFYQRATARETELARAEYDARQADHNRRRNAAMSMLEIRVNAKFWAGAFMELGQCTDDMVTNAGVLAQELNALFTRWRRAKQLYDFLDAVESKFRSLALSGRLHEQQHQWDLYMKTQIPEQRIAEQFWLRKPSVNRLARSDLDQFWHTGSYPEPVTHPQQPHPQQPRFTPAPRNCPPLPLATSTEYLEIAAELRRPLEDSWRLAHSTGGQNSIQEFPADLRQRLNQFLERVQLDRSRAWERVCQALHGQGPVDAAFRRTGLHDKPIPLNILPFLTQPSAGQVPNADASMVTAIGAYAICLRAEQRALRCLRLLERADMSAWLAKELHPQSAGSVNWTPEQYPGWVLLEIDNDFCIREQQAAVAKEMVSRESRNRLLQLNMGEGKTAVIVPMVITALADGVKLLRVTVLSSLCTTNAADWQLKLGGMLGRRVYPLLCRRDLSIKQKEADCIEKMCGRLRTEGHVLVTVPEHRLSLENKAVELAWKGDKDASRALHQVLQFFQYHVRDVLDESDEILHAKYQLIYTLGNPQELDEGRRRWDVASNVLTSVANRAQELADLFGQEAVKFMPGTPSSEFPQFRLLAGATETQEVLVQGDVVSSSAYDQLCRWIVDDMVAGLKIPLRPCDRPVFEQCLLVANAENTPWLSLDESLRPLAYLLRGLLSHQVLLLALSKRWRVEYGVPPAGVRRMAVPYRAKDVAAERTEFGHPDVAILLTILTYYRGGLKDDDLNEAFVRLGKKSEARATAIYGEWATEVGDRMPAALRTYAGVNLDDRDTTERVLFPLLRKHRGVIDFWLDHVVFPVEAKQFPQKLVSTAWDLCPEGPTTTGFSGTDDASLLLPLTIEQRNLQELAHTNGTVLRNLLQTENDHYEALGSDAGANAILDLLLTQDPKVNVLLDAGALVIDMTNEQVAWEWLQKRPDMEAAIYFGPGNDILVVNRDRLVMPLAVSPYERSLRKCLLYLDDIHTRGSDFRLPIESRAAVTLGRGMQKDKLVQACMRMRLLGNGHTVLFFAAFEVDLQIQDWRERAPTRGVTLQNLPAIISWCLANTARATADKLIYWAAQGLTKIRKICAYSHGLDDLDLLAKSCAEDEIVWLKDMYGQARAQEFLSRIVAELLQRPRRGFEATPGRHSFRKLQRGIQERIDKLAGDVQRPASLLDEEQERELEKEVEEEREVERPPHATPAKPELSPGLLELASTGRTSVQFLDFQTALQRTSYRHLVEWGRLDVRVTPDFVKTVQDLGDLDHYLRPVAWMLVGSSTKVLISNFEAEAIAGAFSQSGNSRLQLVAARVRPRQRPVSDHALPVAVEVFAGTLHGPTEATNDEVVQAIRGFMGLSIPTSRSPAWTEFFNDGIVGMDGFVAPARRAGVACEDPALLTRSPFKTSPVVHLNRLYASRHLSAELASSPIGSLLGATAI